METFTIVRTEYLNHHGYLFGGQLLLWVDEYAWLAAARENPGCRLVTRGMDRVEFHRSAPPGSILRFDIRETQRGTTSLHYTVDVYCDAPGSREEYQIFSTTVTFVNVDESGAKVPLCCIEGEAPATPSSCRDTGNA
jgi:acyl-CoA hydrolase